MIPSMDSLNAFSASWADAMLRASWQGGLALLVVWLLSRIPSLPARIKCWLWRVAYLKLLLVLVWNAPLFELPLLRPPPPQPTVADIPIIAEATIESSDLIDTQPPLPTFADGLPLIREKPPVRPTAATLVLVIWFVSLLLAVLLLIRSWHLARRLRRASQPIDNRELLDICADLSQHYRLRHPPRLATAPGIPSALLIGVVQPLILLPDRLANIAQPADLRLMLAHELAHLQRRDLLWNWLPTIVHALFLFHPLAWLARREYRLAQESACDAAALHATGARPSEYGAMILAAVSSATAFTRRRLIDKAAPALAVGIVSSSSRKDLERRLIAMTTIRPWSRQRIVLSALMIAVIASVGLVPWRIVAQEPGAAANDPKAPAVEKKPGNEMRIFTLRRALAADMAAHVLRLFRRDGEQSSGVDATADERTNAIVVVAPAATMKEIEEILQKLDGKPDANAVGDPAAHGDVPGGRRTRGGEGAAAERIRFFGHVFADVITLRAPADGTIQQVKVREGESAKKGDILIQLDDRRARAAVTVAEAKREVAQIQSANARQIRERGAGTASEAHAAEAALRVATAELELTRQDLQDLQIISPRSGVVSNTAVHEGELVQKGARTCHHRRGRSAQNRLPCRRPTDQQHQARPQSPGRPPSRQRRGAPTRRKSISSIPTPIWLRTQSNCARRLTSPAPRFVPGPVPIFTSFHLRQRTNP